MTIIFINSPHYERSLSKFVKNSPQKGKKVIKTLNILSINPFYPSLHIEKLLGTEIWSCRIDKNSRIFFSWSNRTSIYLVDIGPHDKYREY